MIREALKALFPIADRQTRDQRNIAREFGHNQIPTLPTARQLSEARKGRRPLSDSQAQVLDEALGTGELEIGIAPTARQAAKSKLGAKFGKRVESSTVFYSEEQLRHMRREGEIYDKERGRFENALFSQWAPQRLDEWIRKHPGANDRQIAKQFGRIQDEVATKISNMSTDTIKNFFERE